MSRGAVLFNHLPMLFDTQAGRFANTDGMAPSAEKRSFAAARRWAGDSAVVDINWLGRVRPLADATDRDMLVSCILLCLGFFLTLA